MTQADDNDSTEFDALAKWMDADARGYACAALGQDAGGSPVEQVDRIRQALEGDGERLLAMLRPEDLVAVLRAWWFQWDGRRTHLLGVREASLEELRVAARRLMIDGWIPRRRTQPDVPGTVLQLCWYDVGTAHAGEFDDDDGLDDEHEGVDDELADEAIYTIIAPEHLDGHERTGIRFEEGRPWVAGARYLEKAQEEGRRLVVVFADAKATGRLVGWSFVRSLTVTTTTVCETGPIVRLRRARTDSIRKLSDGEPLADEYIRPYVPCQCPSFVKRTVDRMRALLGDSTLAIAPTEPVAAVEMSHAAPPRATPPRAAPPPVAAPIAEDVPRASPPRPAPPRAARPPVATPIREAVPAAGGDPLLAFSWGYEGWGSHTTELVEMIDAVEASRGFGPPLFVDVRLKRVVRAIGFRERAFEKLLGERYVWLQGLGNVAVGDHSLAMALADPSQATTLLDLVEQRAATGSRVIFFCSCGSPVGRGTCHRGKVVEALLAVARKRTTSLAVHEWPGGSPVVMDIDVSSEHMRRLQAIGDVHDTRMRLPLPAGLSVTRAASLPNLSILRCRSGAEACLAAVSPAVLTTHGWVIPVLWVQNDPEQQRLQDELDAEIARLSLAPLGEALAMPPRWRFEPLGGDIGGQT